MGTFSTAAVSSLSLSASGTFVAAACSSRSECLTIAPVSRPSSNCISLPAQPSISILAPSLTSIAFSQDNAVYACDSRGSLTSYAFSDTVTKLFTIPAAHSGSPLTDVAVSSGTFLATAGKDGLIKCWDIETRDCIARLSGHKYEVRAVSIARSEELGVPVHVVASAGRDKTVRLWDVRASTSSAVHVFNGHTSWVHDVSLCGGYKPRVLSCAGDKTVRVWDLVALKEELVLTGHEYRVWGVAAAPNGKFAVSGSTDATVRAWNLADNVQPEERSVVLEGHRDSVLAVAVANDASFAVSGCEDGSLFVWNCETLFNTQRDDEPASELKRAPVFAPHTTPGVQITPKVPQHVEETLQSTSKAALDERQLLEPQPKQAVVSPSLPDSSKLDSRSERTLHSVDTTSDSSALKVKRLEELLSAKEATIKDKDATVASLQASLSEKERQVDQLKLQLIAAENLAKEANVRALIAGNSKREIDDSFTYTEPISRISKVTGQLKALASRLDEMITS